MPSRECLFNVVDESLCYDVLNFIPGFQLGMFIQYLSMEVEFYTLLCVCLVSFLLHKVSRMGFDSKLTTTANIFLNLAKKNSVNQSSTFTSLIAN